MVTALSAAGAIFPSPDGSAGSIQLSSAFRYLCGLGRVSSPAKRRGGVVPHGSTAIPAAVSVVASAFLGQRVAEHLAPGA